MGFDNGECYMCYAEECVNNLCGRADICMTCFATFIEKLEKGYSSTRWKNGLAESIKEHGISNGTCCMCKKTCNTIINLSLCSKHGGSDDYEINE
jgi:hypothetical protein